MHYVRLIDGNGLFISDAFVEKLTLHTIETPCPEGFYLPKWDGTKWIEGGTPSTPQPSEPTLEERVAAVENEVEEIKEKVL